MLVYYADDDHEDQLILSEAIREIDPDIQLRTFENGEHLVYELIDTATQPDLIILDVNMPKCNGYDALGLIRNYPNCENIPIVLMSTSSKDMNLKQTIRLGGKEFFQKPITYSGYLQIASKLITMANNCDRRLFNA